MFGALYDSLQTSSVLQYLVCNPLLNEIAAQLMNEDSAGLTATGHMMRLDAPEDKRNSLGWHQENYYYNMNLAGENGAVVWFPLHDLTPEHGPVVVCPKSHKEGTISPLNLGKKDHLTSEQFHIPEEEINKYEEKQVVIKAGDVLFFNMDVFHRSGSNTSKHIRFVAGVHYHRALADDFLPGRLSYRPSEKTGRKINQYAPEPKN